MSWRKKVGVDSIANGKLVVKSFYSQLRSRLFTLIKLSKEKLLYTKLVHFFPMEFSNLYISVKRDFLVLENLKRRYINIFIDNKCLNDFRESIVDSYQLFSHRTCREVDAVKKIFHIFPWKI